jgi:hypothetical protein
MTIFGKILVLLILSLSMTLGAWSMLFYTTFVDWTDNKAQDGKPAGELVRRQADATTGWNKIQSANPTWEESHSTLLAMEMGSPRLSIKGKEYKINGRDPNLRWYQDELKFLRERSKEKEALPCQALKLDDQLGLIAADADPLTPRPQMAGATDRLGNALRHWQWYIDEEKTTVATLTDVEKKLTKVIEEDSELTTQLTGPKGLRGRLIDERVKREEVMFEHGLVKTPLINTYVETELLLKRKRSLEARLEELRKARAARVAAVGNQ